MNSTTAPTTNTRTLPFFLIALGLAWVSLLPNILARQGLLPGPPEQYLAFAPLAVLSPLLAAMLVSRFEPGGAGALAALRPLRDWRRVPAWWWYVIALWISPALLSGGVAIYKLAGGTEAIAYFSPPDTTERILAMFFIPLGEETGWRGFALPRLQQRYSRLGASVLVGIGWAIWHIPLFLATGTQFGATMVAFRDSGDTAETGLVGGRAWSKVAVDAAA